MAETRLVQSEQERVRAKSSAANEGPTLNATVEHPLQRLQRQVGNAEIARLLAQRESESAEGEEEELQMKHDPALAQRESESAEDEEEELQAKHDPALAQRESESGEDEEEELQMKHDPAQAQRSAAGTEEAPRIGLEGGPVDSDLQSRINGQRGQGAGLSDGIRRNMEGAFGTSFEDVRVHTGGEADSLNRSMTARAFTTGSDIFLRNDASASDSSLLAHELTHVVQQRSGGGGGGGGMQVGPAGDHSEQEADSVAQSIAAGSPQRLADEIARQH